MYAFIEWLCSCRRAGVLRAGVEAKRYGDPYELAAAFSVDGSRATIKALVVPPTAKLKFSFYRAVKEALAAEGLIPEWERITDLNVDSSPEPVAPASVPA